MAKNRQVGSLWKNTTKDGKRDYLSISLTEDVEKGRTIFLSDPEEKLKFLLDNGHIDEESYNKKLKNLPENLKYNLEVGKS